MWPTLSLLVFVLLGHGFAISVTGLTVSNHTIGINYGMVGNNLPPPEKAMKLIKSMGITKVKIYSANASVLRTFANSEVSFIVGIGNEELHSLTILQNAVAWVQENIAPYLSTTPISAIAVGNEVLTTNNTQLISDLLPAIQNLHSALSTLPLAVGIAISTPHSLAILSTSYPPSNARFDPSLLMASLKPLSLFLSQTGAPFMINAYPYFAYKGNPSTIPLPYVLFESNDGVKDTNTGLLYYNMLDAQVDAIYSAMQALGFTDVNVMVTETGWPSAGDADETGASEQNAQAYNSNLMKRLASHKGTPMRPKIPLEAYIFSLFNENSKPGPTSERNYGLYKPDGTKVYDLGMDVVDSVVSSHNFYSDPSVSKSPYIITIPFVSVLLGSTLLGVITSFSL